MKDDKKLPSPQDATPDFAPNSDIPPDADVEERFNDFWKRNGPSIFAVIGIIALIVVGYEVYGYMQQRKAEKLAETYATLESAEAKLEFANDNPNTELGGLAYLQLADEAYAAGNYVDAASRYDAALRGLAETPMSGQARLGAAMARLRQGDETASSLLDQIARDPSVLAPIRGEAAYLLATSYWERENYDQLRRTLDLLGTIEGAPTWQQMGVQLESLIPELRDSE